MKSTQVYYEQGILSFFPVTLIAYALFGEIEAIDAGLADHPTEGTGPKIDHLFCGTKLIRPWTNSRKRRATLKPKTINRKR